MHFLCLLSYSVLRGQARLGETADGALHIPLAGPMHDARRACSVLVEETKTQKCPLHWKQWAPYPSPHRAFLYGDVLTLPHLLSLFWREDFAFAWSIPSYWKTALAGLDFQAGRSKMIVCINSMQ